jgi:hypothetical protein
MLYVLVTGLTLAATWRLAGGHLVYVIDDPYITMAMAKNLALHGQWGITPFQFSSSSSSPLFTLLLAVAYRLTGVRPETALLLSWCFGLVSLWAASRLLRRYVELWVEGLTLLSIVLLTPLFVTGTLGMEHSLHLLLCLLLAARWESSSPGATAKTGLLVAAICGVRYEGLLMAAVLVLLLLLDRRWLRAGVVAVAAWVPVGVYAVFSLAHGGDWLPNSVALKGLHVSGLGFAARVAAMRAVLSSNLYRGLPLCMLLGAVIVVGIGLAVSRKGNDHERRQRLLHLLTLVGGTGILHLLTGDVGWAFRYEDYLIGLGLVAIVCALPPLHEINRLACVAGTLLFTCALLLLSARAVLAAALLPRYSQAVYRQQLQTAQFLGRYYAGAEIAANDIGLINFTTDLHCLDLSGLASAEVFRAKRAGNFTTAAIDQETIAAGTRIAVVYDTFFTDSRRETTGPLFGPALPKSWVRVGRWSVPETLQLGDRTVSFYAVRPEEARALRAHLAEYERLLPSGVTVQQN